MSGVDYDCDCDIEDPMDEEKFFVAPADIDSDTKLQEKSLGSFSTVDRALKFARDLSAKSSINFLTYKKESTYEEEKVIKLTRDA